MLSLADGLSASVFFCMGLADSTPYRRLARLGQPLEEKLEMAEQTGC